MVEQGGWVRGLKPPKTFAIIIIVRYACITIVMASHLAIGVPASKSTGHIIIATLLKVASHKCNGCIMKTIMGGNYDSIIIV